MKKPIFVTQTSEKEFYGFDIDSLGIDVESLAFDDFSLLKLKES